MFDFNLEFARGGANLTVDIFRKLVAGGLNGNIIFSPFSIQACVALAFAGAQGETAEEIANGLKYVSPLPSEVAETFQFVLDKYKDSNLLKVANKAYVQDGKQLKADYLSALQTQYHAEAEEIDFGDNLNAANAINQWVSQKTAGKIDQLISPDAITSLTRLVLLNALHFKGSWEHKFDESQTEEDDFWTGEEESVKVQYMNLKAKFGYGYFDELGCQALEMPYKDSDLSMFILLPNERNALKPLAEKLQNINLVDLSERMSTEEVVVKFPKFKVDYSREISGVLQQLGIKKMFTEDAEFNNMLESPESVFVSKIFHRASIEINEEGSEASAATGMIMMTRMMLVPTQFQADRPFLYMIWNKRNILFAGAFVNAPESQ